MKEKIARIKFLEWLDKTNPEAYQAVMREASGNLNSVGGIWDNIVDAAQKIIPGVVQAKAQRDLYRMQLRRAERGLPPIDASAIAPVVKVQADIAPQTRQAIMEDVSSGAKKYILPMAVAGIALIAIAIFTKKK